MRITVLALVVALAGLAVLPEAAAQPAGTLYRIACLSPGVASTPDKTATAVGLTVPQSILLRADEVIR